MILSRSSLLITSLTGLIIFGITFVTSASVYVAVDLTGDPFYFAKREIIFIFLGVLAILISANIPTDLYHKYDWVFLLMSLALLIALFIPGIGKVVNGSLRWIDLGFFNLQPSELVKLALILYIAGYSVRRTTELSTLIGFIRPMMILSLLSLLILLQPDLGSTVIICSLVLIMLFFAGISFSQFLFLISVLGFLAYIAIIYTPFRLARLVSFRDPFAPEFELSSGWQLSNALIGIGRGDLFGIGLGNSIQKNLYLPEPHTDFIFAIILEETGIIGGFLLMLLFILLITSIVQISFDALRQNRLFQGYVCFGIGSLLSIQSIFNIGVNIGLLPTKGLTLPFISYGGASLIIFMLMMGIVFRVDFENIVFKINPKNNTHHKHKNN